MAALKSEAELAKKEVAEEKEKMFSYLEEIEDLRMMVNMQND